MAKFLNTSATNYFLEEMIKEARERLILISPFLRFNDRIKELLEDKDRMKIDVRIVYGKSELNPHEMNWLRSLEFVRTSFCQNLHAKCYINEASAIITSMNLYDFSQVNNNEMGVFIHRLTEPELYKETLEEAQRLIRISEQVRLTAEKVSDVEQPIEIEKDTESKKISSSKIAQKLKLKTQDFLNACKEAGLVEFNNDEVLLTDKGRELGAEEKKSPRFGPYIIWPEDFKI